MSRSVRDGRGRKVTVYEGGDILRSPEDESNVSAAELADLRRRIRQRVPFYARPSLVIDIALLALLMASSAMLLTSGSTTWWDVLIRLAIIAAIAVGMLRARRSFGYARAGTIARVMLEAHRCPACAYSLERVPPQSDGCVVCPECSAAWRLPDQPPATTSPPQTTTSTGLPPNS